MSQATPFAEVGCQDCGAINPGHNAQCWLCYHPLAGSAPPPLPGAAGGQVVSAELVGEPSLAVAAASMLGLSVALLLVGIGAYLVEPGLAIVYAIVVVPPLLATLVTGLARRAGGRPLSLGSRVLTFFVSGVITVGVLGLLCIAAFVAFFVFCLVALSAGGGYH
jgi:hypothetical protein